MNACFTTGITESSMNTRVKEFLFEKMVRMEAMLTFTGSNFFKYIL